MHSYLSDVVMPIARGIPPAGHQQKDTVTVVVHVPGWIEEDQLTRLESAHVHVPSVVYKFALLSTTSATLLPPAAKFASLKSCSFLVRSKYTLAVLLPPSYCWLNSWKYKRKTYWTSGFGTDIFVCWQHCIVITMLTMMRSFWCANNTVVGECSLCGSFRSISGHIKMSYHSSAVWSMIVLVEDVNFAAPLWQLQFPQCLHYRHWLLLSSCTDSLCSLASAWHCVYCAGI